MNQLPTGKVIAHVDLDAFYAQVEMRRDPERLSNKPVGVIQYNPWGDLHTYKAEDDRLMNDSNGSLIAVNYQARGYGVKRNHSGHEAKKLCPDIQLVQVPTAHGKADLTIYRTAGKQVLDIFADTIPSIVCERASIDECYLDITVEAQRRLSMSAGIPHLPANPSQIHIYTSSASSASVDEWWCRPCEEWESGELLIAAGAAVVSDLRHMVYDKLGYTCSAGISHTKLLAKLCSGLHKPNQQTLLPAAGITHLLQDLPIPKLRALGGQFGQQVMDDLSIQTVGQLNAIPLSRLQSLYGDKDAHWLYALSRGIDGAEVAERQLPKSTSCGKTFRGTSALTDIPSVHKWLLELASELEERLQADQEENNRMATLLTVSFGVVGKQGSVSRSCSLRKHTASTMAEDAAALVKKWTSSELSWKISDLYLGASNFQPVQTTSITKFFKPSTTSVPTSPNSLGDMKSLEKEQLPLEQQTMAAARSLVQEQEAGPSSSTVTTKVPEIMRDPSLNGSEAIDPEVWASLPPDIRKELEISAKIDAMKSQLTVGKKRAATQQGTQKTQTLKDLLSGKRPKR